jgi:rhodanese-related sulfurtransferase
MTAVIEAVSTISGTELDQRRQAGRRVDLIDVRTPAEFREVHVTFAHNVPLDRLRPREIMESRGGCEEPLYVICRSGKRASQACEQFQAAGYPNVVCVEGGTLACLEAALPVVHGKKAMSLERQVRIVAGLMALVGVLGYFLSPWFLVLPAMVGIGLTHAGVTDSCLMGLILSRMPWNQAAGGQPASQAPSEGCAC